MSTTEAILREVAKELGFARAKFSAFHNEHEAYAVLL